jgi:hypothetical protein
MQRNLEAIRKRVDAWKGPAESAKLVIYPAFAEGKPDVPKAWPGACMISILIGTPRHSLENGRELIQRWFPSLPVQPVTRSLRVSFPDGRASKESPVPKPFRRIVPNVESGAASAPACWISDRRTDAHPRPA